MSEAMVVNVHAGALVDMDDRANQQMTARIDRAFSRFAHLITRVEAHFTDENGDKSGPDDKRCALEVRLRGLDPVVVSHHAPTVELAAAGSLDKAVRVLDRTTAKRRHIKGRDPFDSATA